MHEDVTTPTKRRRGVAFVPTAGAALLLVVVGVILVIGVTLAPAAKEAIIANPPVVLTPLARDEPEYKCLVGGSVVNVAPGEVFAYPGVYLCGIDMKYWFDGQFDELPGTVINAPKRFESQGGGMKGVQ